MMLRALPRAAAGIAASLALQQTCQQSDDRLARWRKRWEGDTRGWELGKTVHPRLAEFEERLLPEPSRVLVPLAGQSHDVAHLAWRGHNVVAVEGVPAALEASATLMSFVLFGPAPEDELKEVNDDLTKLYELYSYWFEKATTS